VARTPGSKKLQEEAARFLPGGSTRTVHYQDPHPAFADRGEGNYVYDVDGNRYLDFVINATSLILGHAHPDIVRVLQEQAALGTAFSGPHMSQIRVAQTLCERVPSVETVRFTNSGTEGTLMAVRAARAFTGRPKIAKFEGGYHGGHEYVEVSVRPPGDRLDPGGPTPIPEYPGQPQALLDDVIVLPYNDLEESERRIRSHAGQIACVIMEAVASNFGYLPARPVFLQSMRDLTDELGIVLIFDEVQSFRVASGGAQERFGVTPDLTAFGKIIGGGMPVGAFGGRRDIMSLFDPSDGAADISHAGTFNANPMTMAAGEVTLDHLTPETFQRMDDLGHMARAKLRAVFDELDIPAQVTGIASLFGIHFTADEITDYRSTLRGDSDMASAFFLGMMNEGVLLQSRCAGALSTLSTEEEIDALVDATRTVIQRIR
jgi:glutamate-1-semialdehyde 2,1-aminomutase